MNVLSQCWILCGRVRNTGDGLLHSAHCLASPNGEIVRRMKRLLPVFRALLSGKLSKKNARSNKTPINRRMREWGTIKVSRLPIISGKVNKEALRKGWEIEGIDRETCSVYPADAKAITDTLAIKKFTNDMFPSKALWDRNRGALVDRWTLVFRCNIYPKTANALPFWEMVETHSIFTPSTKSLWKS